MSEQQHRSSRKSQDEHNEVEPSETSTDNAGKLEDDVDSILDEIDDVLEENAEEFVRSFVQKGGE